MKVAALILTMFLAAVSAAGQRVDISAKEFYKATNPDKRPVRFPMRTSNTEEFFEAGKVFKTVVTEFEGIPAEASRLTITESERGVSKGSEEIENGDFLYTRSGSGEWSKEPWYFRHPGSEVISEFTETFTYWRETNILDSRKVSVVYRSGEIQPFNGVRCIRDDAYYFGSKDKLIKRVTTYRTLGERSVMVRRVTFSSEYDPKIKIEAPIK